MRERYAKDYLDFVKVQRKKGQAFYIWLWEMIEFFPFSVSFDWELKELLQNFQRTEQAHDFLHDLNFIVLAIKQMWCKSELWMREPELESSSQYLVLYRHLDTTEILRNCNTFWKDVEFQQPYQMAFGSPAFGSPAFCPVESFRRKSWWQSWILE